MKPLIGATDRQRWLLCWGVSILLHVGILTFGAILLIEAVRFQVEAGRTSTETDLVIEPAPVRAIPPPTTAPPRPSPARPQVPSPLAPALIKSSTPPLTEPVLAPPSKVAPAQPLPPQSSAKPKSVVTKEAKSNSRGAIEAQPDELHNEPPAYPEDSRAAREEGVVILRVEVSAIGEPSNVSVLKSSGYFRLDQAARRAVLQWKFHPAMTAGIPTASEADVPVHFKLQ